MASNDSLLLGDAFLIDMKHRHLKDFDPQPHNILPLRTSTDGNKLMTLNGERTNQTFIDRIELVGAHGSFPLNPYGSETLYRMRLE